MAPLPFRGAGIIDTSWRRLSRMWWRGGSNTGNNIASSASKQRHLLGNADQLQDGQMKEVVVEVEESKYTLLLYKLNGKYYATSHLCPHYKARLVTGVLTAEGRVKCPWHGACFSVQTGDIEEAPSLQALTSYPIEVEDGKLYVNSAPEVWEGERVRPTCEKFKQDPSDPTCKETFVVVGGGAAGALAAEEIRRAGFMGKLLVVSQEPHLPVDRIKLSKLLGAKLDSISLYQEDYLKSIMAEYQVDQVATGLDPKTKQLILQDGKRIAYSKLLIATGCIPRRLPLPGAQLRNIHVLRGVADNHALLSTIETIPNARVVIIGTSFIGLEVASMLVKRAHSVTVVGPEEAPLKAVLGEQVGRVFQRLHEKNGVKFMLGTLPVSFKAKQQQEEDVGGVELNNSTTIDADLVVLGVGVRPATDFVKDVLSLHKDGSILVDAYMRVIGAEDIYAAGDLARFPSFLHGNDPKQDTLRIEHWSMAEQQGRIAGYNMVMDLTSKASPQPLQMIPFFWTNQYGKAIRYTGSTPKGYQEVIVVGELEGDSPTFAAYYVSEGEIAAVATMGKDPLAIHVSELMRQGRMPSCESIRSGKVGIRCIVNLM